MKSFKNHVKEETSLHTPVNTTDIVSFYESIDIKKYKDVLDFIAESNGTNYIYRGLYGTKYFDFMEITPNKSVRKSANEKTNIYNMLVSDILECWSGYPKRSKSAICTTNSSTARGYGNIFVVIPQNHAMFGVCNSDDFWMSFDNTLEDVSIRSMEIFSTLLLQFIIYCGNVLQIPSIKKADMMGMSSSTLKHFLEVISYHLNIHSTINDKKSFDIDLILKYAFRTDKTGDFSNAEHDTFMENRNLNKITELFYKYHKGDTINLLGALETILDPYRNDFKLMDFDTLMLGVNGRKLKDNEVWTNSNALLINEDSIDSFIRYYIHNIT